MGIQRPEIDFPGGEPPAELQITDIWEGDGGEAQPGERALKCEPLPDRAQDRHVLLRPLDAQPPFLRQSQILYIEVHCFGSSHSGRCGLTTTPLNTAAFDIT